jgi:hypothetical protein
VENSTTETVFPFLALETQKQWMSRYMKKPYYMTAKTMTHAMRKINNFLPYFPEAGMDDKYSETELIGILQFALPEYYRAAFDLRDYIPAENNKIKFISECERVERNAKPKSHERDDDDDERKNNKKSSLRNPRSRIKKMVQKRLRRTPVCIVRSARLRHTILQVVTS